MSRGDVPRIRKAQKEWDRIEEKICSIWDTLRKDGRLEIYVGHFDKIESSHLRNRWIYELCLASIGYDNAKSEEAKREYLKRMSYCNERDFELVKKKYFDVNPVEMTGVRSCMYPYHEIKRVITNTLHPERRDDNIIYLGGEALGWLWLK